MINRILIRIKVLQIVYSYYQNGSGDLKLADKELMFSLQKSYDLYYYLLLLIVEVTNLHRRTLDIRKHKFMPTEEDLNPNTRLIDNRFVAQLEQNEMLQKYVSEQGISWANDEEFVKDVLDSILASDIYADYLKNPEDNYDVDREFWRSTFKNLICCSDDVEEYLEDKSIYDYRQRIEKHIKNWETDRIASIDLYIMQVALTEIMTFPTIPISVTLNEYIDIAKHYSTPKSGIFINGILDSIVNELKSEQLLLKD